MRLVVHSIFSLAITVFFNYRSLCCASSCPSGWTDEGSFCYQLIQGPSGSYLPIPGGWLQADRECKSLNSRAFLLANQTALLNLIAKEVSPSAFSRPSFVYAGAGSFNGEPEWTSGNDTVSIRNCSLAGDLGSAPVVSGECGIAVLPSDWSNNYCMVYVKCGLETFYTGSTGQYFALCQLIPSSVDCTDGGLDPDWRLSQDGENCFKIVNATKKQSWDQAFCDILKNNTNSVNAGQMATVNSVATLMWMGQYVKPLTTATKGFRVAATEMGFGTLTWTDGSLIQPFIPSDNSSSKDDACITLLIHPYYANRSPLQAVLHHVKCFTESVEPTLYQKNPAKKSVTVDKRVLDSIANFTGPNSTCQFIVDYCSHYSGNSDSVVCADSFTTLSSAAASSLVTNTPSTALFHTISATSSKLPASIFYSSDTSRVATSTHHNKFTTNTRSTTDAAV